MNAEQSKDKIFDIEKLVDEINKVGIDKVHTEMQTYKPELDKLIAQLSPYSEENIVAMIANYAIILSELEANDRSTSNISQEARIKHLMSAAFSVGFALGGGAKAAEALPLLAIAGVHNNLGDKIITHYRNL